MGSRVEWSRVEGGGRGSRETRVERSRAGRGCGVEWLLVQIIMLFYKDSAFTE